MPEEGRANGRGREERLTTYLPSLFPLLVVQQRRVSDDDNEFAVLYCQRD